MYALLQQSDGRTCCFENNQLIVLDIQKGMTDTQIKDEAKRNGFNGPYTYKICRGCGAYWTKEDGHCETAEIVDQCKECFEDSNEKG